MGLASRVIDASPRIPGAAPARQQSRQCVAKQTNASRPNRSTITHQVITARQVPLARPMGASRKITLKLKTEKDERGVKEKTVEFHIISASGTSGSRLIESLFIY